MQRNASINIATPTMLRFFAIILGLVAVYILRDVIISLLFAVILAAALEPVVVRLKAYGIPRILGAIFLFLFIAILLLLAVYFIVPLLVESVNHFFLTYESLQSRILTSVRGANIFPDTLISVPDLRNALDAPLLKTFGGGIFNFIGGIFGGVFSFVLVVVLSFYLTAQEKGIEGFLRMVTPLRHEEYVIGLWNRAQTKLGRWFRAQVILAVIVGLLIFLGLSLLGVEHALLFAVIVALFEIIPVVGPILAAIPAIVAAFLMSPTLGVSVMILYIIVQQIESHVIVPVVMRRAVGLSPLVVVLALVTGATFGGIFGILLSVPITAIAAEFIEDWDKKKRAIMPE